MCICFHLHAWSGCSVDIQTKKGPPPHPTLSFFFFFFFFAAVIFYSEGRRYVDFLITNEEQKSKLAPDVEELAEASALLVCINSVS